MKATDSLMAEVEARPGELSPKQALVAHLTASGSPTLALRLAQRFVLLDANADHYVLLASVHLEIGDAPGAARLLERATQLAPESEMAHRQLAAAYEAMGRAEEAALAAAKADAIAHARP